MKNKLTIKNAQGEYLQHVVFEDQKAQDEFIEMLAATYAWGRPEHQVEILGENDMSFEPKQFETIPAEYTIEVEDISAQVDQEKINEEAQAFLDSTDAFVIRFMETGVEMPEGMSEARQEARERIIR